jgi:uridine phosphorylase
MVFAARESKDFITPDEVERVQVWAGKAVLEALVGYEISAEVSLAGKPLVSSFWPRC